MDDTQRDELDKQITTYHLFYYRYMIKIRYILCVSNKNDFYVIALIALDRIMSM